MPFTRPKAAQIDFDVTNISDPLIRLNSGQSGSNDKDVGIIVERGSDTNTAILWDESADQFVLVNTTEDGTTSGNVTIASYAGVRANAIVYGSLNVGSSTLTSTIAELNILDGVTATATELNYVSGVTSAIQTQIDNISSSFTLAADSGSNDTFTTGQTLTIAGGTGIGTTVSDNNISIAIDSTVATLTGTQTLTNKTLTAPIISSISNTGALTLPSSTDTLVGRATTDTLTNKTLTSAQVSTDIRLNAQAELEFYDSDSSHYVAFRAPATVASSLTWTLPATDGTADQVLATNGAGTLSWADAGSGGGGSGSSFPNSTFQTVPGTDGDFDLAKNVAQTVTETPFEASGTDAFGVNLGSVFSLMDPVGTTDSIDYGDGEAHVGA